MPYIGNQPAEQFTSFATQEFSTSATTSYTLDHAVTNENEIALFINNVRQQPGSGKAYTASSTTLTLSEATASTDTMYCVFLGRALQTVTPATNSITNAMITDSTIESGKLFSTFKNGITVADQWRLSADLTGVTSQFITANLEQIDSSGQGTLGSAMTQSSGVFTFPSTGIYLVSFNLYVYTNQNDGFVDAEIHVTTNNSSYAEVARATAGIYMGSTGDTVGNSCLAQTLIDVTDTSNVKVKFYLDTLNSTTTVKGSSTSTNTGFTFIRLGDT
jgi:hypothetical protein